jgi:phospholipid/cholesterol/gamma-HCH transport system substrate-binding protein
MRRTRRARLTNVQIGVIAAVVLLPLLYLAFTKHVPGTHGFRVSAVFRNAVNIKPASPVRIAGVDVGKVTGVRSYGPDGAAEVQMELDHEGLPLHTDATLKIRPRLFLEGSFFVDLEPGTPAGKAMPEGFVVPLTQTANAVQIDQVLSTLTQPIRADLQHALEGFGQALSAAPTPAADAAQDPLVRGMTGAEALNDTYRRSGPVLKDVSIVNQALLGTEPDDLPKLLTAITYATGELGRSESALQGFVRGLDGTLGAFASQSDALAAGIAELPGALDATRRAFAGITATAPGLRTFARGFTVVAEQLPESYRVTPAWIDALMPLLGPEELGGIAADLRTMAPLLDQVVTAQTEIAPQVDDSALCGTRVVLPTLNAKLEDGALSSGLPNYQELWNGLVGFAGGAQNRDGNGVFARLFAGAGDTVVTSGAGPDGKVSGGRAAAPPKGTSPRYPGFGKNPPFKPEVPCRTQQRPALGGSLAHGPADRSRTP